MRHFITIATLVTVGRAVAQSSDFKLPKCAKSCLALSASCDNTADFCSSSCFGPCLTTGCSDAYEQQQLIRACRNPFDDVMSSSVTVTQRPKPRPSSSTESETRTATRTPKEPEPTPMDKDAEEEREEQQRLSEQRAKASALASANRTASLNHTLPSNSSLGNGTAGEDDNSASAAAPGLTRPMVLCGLAAVAGAAVLFA